MTYRITATVPTDRYYQLLVERPARLEEAKHRSDGRTDLIFETPDPEATVQIIEDGERVVFGVTRI